MTTAHSLPHRLRHSFAFTHDADVELHYEAAQALEEAVRLMLEARDCLRTADNPWADGLRERIDALVHKIGENT